MVNPIGGNYARYSNTTVDHLLTQGASTFSQAARAPLSHAVDRILSAQAPDIFLWWNDSPTLANKNLGGYDPNLYAFATFGTFKHGIGSRGFQIFLTRKWMVHLEDVNGDREPQGDLAVIERKR